VGGKGGVVWVEGRARAEGPGLKTVLEGFEPFFTIFFKQSKQGRGVGEGKVLRNRWKLSGP